MVKFLMIATAALYIPFVANSTTGVLPAVHAQGKDSVAVIRQRYATINKTLARYRVVKKELSGFSTEGGELAAYLDGKVLVKIAVANQGETYRSFEDFYFSEGQLIFVFEKEERYDEPYSGRVAKTTENRFYFNDDKLIRWIEGKTKQVTPGRGRYLEKQDHYLKLSKLFAEGTRSKSAMIENP